MGSILGLVVEEARVGMSEGDKGWNYLRCLKPGCGQPGTVTAGAGSMVSMALFGKKTATSLLFNRLQLLASAR